MTKNTQPGPDVHCQLTITANANYSLEESCNEKAKSY